jgi:hypothetical protein
MLAELFRLQLRTFSIIFVDKFENLNISVFS